jgi:hypothetical protein
MKPKDFQELFPESKLREFDGVQLETLRSWDVLAASCSCGHFGIVNRALLLKRYENHYLMTLETKLKCVRCKTRGTSKFWIGKQPRD